MVAGGEAWVGLESDALPVPPLLAQQLTPG